MSGPMDHDHDHDRDHDEAHLIGRVRRRALGDSLRRAMSPPIDASIDRSIREGIHSHDGFRRNADRSRLRVGVLAGSALAAAAAMALWFGGVGSLLFSSNRAATTSSAPNPISRDLAEAVRLTRLGAGETRVPAMLAAIVASATAAGEPREPGAHFVAVDLVVEAPDGVDGLVLDLLVADPRGVIVGLESGDGPFAEPPTYDADRLARGEVRIASIPADAAVGRVRVATISLRCDAADPGVDARIVSAVRERGGEVKDVDARVIVSPRSSP